MYLCRPKSMADVILLIQDSEIQSSEKKYLKRQDRATRMERATYSHKFELETELTDSFSNF